MIILASTSDLVTVTTGSALNLDVHASWADFTTTSITFGRTNTLITTATTTTIVGSPAASTERSVKTVTIYNRDASSANLITVKHSDGTNIPVIEVVSLPAGYTLAYDELSGWTLLGPQTTVNTIPKTIALGAIGDSSIKEPTSTSDVFDWTASGGYLRFVTDGAGSNYIQSGSSSATSAQILTIGGINNGVTYASWSATGVLTTAHPVWVSLNDNATGSLQVGTDVGSTTGTDNGFQIQTAGSVYINTKTATGGSTVFRTGSGTSSGYTNTWLTVDGSGDVAIGASTANSHTINGVTKVTIGSSGVSAYTTDVVLQIETLSTHNAYINFTATGAKGIIASNASSSADGYVLYDQTSRSWTVAAAGTIYWTFGAAVATFAAPLTIGSGGLYSSTNFTSNSFASANGGAFVNSNTAQTATNFAFRGLQSGTYNTTAGTLSATAVEGVATSTRSSGSNALTNIGVHGYATGAQTNYAIMTDGGVVALATDGSATTIGGSVTVSGAAVMSNTLNVSTELYSHSNGTFDTTAGNVNNFANYFEANATRSSGSNSLINFAGFFDANNAQTNYAIYTAHGDVQLNVTSGSTTVGGSLTCKSSIGLIADTSSWLQLGEYNNTSYKTALIESVTSGANLALRVGGIDVLTIANAGGATFSGPLTVDGPLTLSGNLPLSALLFMSF